MAKKEKYRLQPLLQVRLKNKRKTEIALSKAMAELKAEEEKLKVLEKEKQDIIARRENSRREMAEKIAMGESVVYDTQVHLNFLKKLQEDEEQKDKEIEEQKEAIKRAEEKLAQAKRDYIDACKEVKIMEKHKELWQKKLKKKLEFEENKMMNELGNVIHQLRKMK